jgi:hypothetical protein
VSESLRALKGVYFILSIPLHDGEAALPKSYYKEKEMSAKKHFTTEQAREIGDKLDIDWGRFDVEQFRMGLDVELEHGLHDPATDVTGNDPILTGKIALAHLNEFADYYTRLEKMEREAEEKIIQADNTKMVWADDGGQIGPKNVDSEAQPGE